MWPDATIRKTAEDILKIRIKRTESLGFSMFDKLHVKGDNQHPLYTALTGDGSPFPGAN
ncbi:MAG: hypothetical protein M2R45_00668 [Verrucomicrobia subdivision 3 bacterium]|nr:hypothetical protein [Limisphaerales bacterium]MCS1414448.1 hypothetical protein [Limisphaerales bacterium]